MKSEGPPSGSETLLIGPSQLDVVMLTRYRLRLVAHRIVADCERLLAEVEGLSREAWQQAVGKALVAALRLRSIVERGGAPEDSATAGALLDQVYVSIRRPQQAVVDAMTTLLALIPTDPMEGLIMQDARVIRDAAIGLLAADGPARSTGSVPGQRASSAIASPGPSGNTSVLVVDDDDALRRELARLLTRMGYSVSVAEDGREALTLAERELPDLVITDLAMPEMTGHELLARLKAGETTQHIPVIVVSGEGDSASVVRCLELGAEDHLTKPYEPLVLQARIRTSIERKRMRDLEVAYLRRVGQLMSAAEAVERHAYDSGMLAELTGERDELAQLARVFDRMMNSVRMREEQLEARVRELRREIEQVVRPLRPSEKSEHGSFEVGHVLAGRYEIKRELGAGGMGVVYLARDRDLAVDIAVKVVHPDVIGRDPTLRERLKSEVRLARLISHKNVVRSHDLGEWQGMYFVTMEYIKGVTVAELIGTRGRLGVDSTIAIGTQLAEALAVAHAAEVIHRDIKPENLMVDDGGTLKVTDFGLARPVQRVGELTHSGYVAGTPHYMAPEQVLGGNIDARTDLFATGAVFYLCLTGRIPFAADTPLEVLARMLGGQPQPVREIEPSVPPALAAVVERLLQRDPGMRYQSARELADNLASIG